MVVVLALATALMLVGARRPVSAEPGGYEYGPGYWLASADGGVFAYGHAGYIGSPGAEARARIVGIAPTVTGRGYWLAAADGGVFAYGDAQFYGGAHGVGLRRPIVGITPTPTGFGYWLVGADGGVFAFGDAPWLGAPGDLGLRRPVVGMAATPTGDGYWVVAADGGVFAYGDAQFLGAPQALALRAPVVGITATLDGQGYWVVAGDGGVFAYGDAGFFGSPDPALRMPIVGLAASPTGHGYWLASADGGVFAYGDAGFFGSMAGHLLGGRVVGIGGGYAPEKPQQPVSTALSATTGYDISWPQCDKPQPVPPYGFGLVGVTGGRAFTTNPCLGEQVEWARASGSAAGVYVNINAPRDGSDPHDFGARTVRHAVGYADAHGLRPPMWWLDVETMNYWSDDTNLNTQVVEGAIDELHRQGFTAGVYSTGYQWGQIVGGYAPGLPVWYAGASDLPTATAWCNRAGFGGGQVWLVQTVIGDFDNNVACAPVTAQPERVFAMAPPPLAPVMVRRWPDFS